MAEDEAGSPDDALLQKRSRFGQRQSFAQSVIVAWQRMTPGHRMGVPPVIHAQDARATSGAANEFCGQPAERNQHGQMNPVVTSGSRPAKVIADHEEDQRHGHEGVLL